LRALKKACFVILSEAKDLVFTRFFGRFALSEWQKSPLLQRSHFLFWLKADPFSNTLLKIPSWGLPSWFGKIIGKYIL
jgi:hypothetical protein